MPETWSLGLIVLVALCAALYGFSKIGMPGAGMVAGTALAAALGPAVASGFALPLLLVGDVLALRRYRQHADWRLIGRLLPGVAGGLLLTAGLFLVLDRTQLSRMLGVLILTSVILEVRRSRGARETETTEEPRWQQRAWVAFFGTLAGMTTMAANAGGAATTLYLLKARVSMLAFMGTSAWFFAIVNLAKVPIMVPLGYISWQTLRINLWFVPAVLIGAWLGSLAFRRMSQQVFSRVALLLSAMAATWLLVHG